MHFLKGKPMYTLNIGNNVEQKLTKAAQDQGKTIDQVLNDLIFEYLDDLEDGCLAEAALLRIESGESTLVDWQDVKKQLHELEN